MDALDEILAVADAVMVARGDLGVELSPAEVPLIQKDVIAKSIQAAKPVITATQMLRSMVDSPQPTRAEAADVANAVLDSSDAVMLSGGECHWSLSRASGADAGTHRRTAEKRLLSQRQTAVAFAHANMSTSAAIGHAACLLASEAGATAIVCCTRTGRTAQLVAKYRPVSPIIAVSQHHTTVRRLMLTWGVHPRQAEPYDTIDTMIEAALKAARSSGFVTRGDRVVLVGGSPSAPLEIRIFSALFASPKAAPICLLFVSFSQNDPDLF